MYCSTEMKSEALPLDIVDSPNFPGDSQVSFTLAARLLLWSVAQMLCR
jgi:hypothetical protein